MAQLAPRRLQAMDEELLIDVHAVLMGSGADLGVAVDPRAAVVELERALLQDRRLDAGARHGGGPAPARGSFADAAAKALAMVWLADGLL